MADLYLDALEIRAAIALEDGHGLILRPDTVLDLCAKTRSMARWIAESERRRDHACARCFPGGSLVVADFTCAQHTAEDINKGADRG